MHGVPTSGRQVAAAIQCSEFAETGHCGVQCTGITYPTAGALTQAEAPLSSHYLEFRFQSTLEGRDTQAPPSS